MRFSLLSCDTATTRTVDHIPALIGDHFRTEIVVETAKDTTLYINKKVAEQLGIKIPDSLAERATFVEE